ncbi:MAG TPA: hypothetical protein VM008_17060 [Phycisphaerae bacterium]|nr:hypothetical protein [Phycisphaerae bacterium]
MKRALIASLLLSSAALVGCENSTSTAYDPQYDGITTIAKASPDMSIMDNQKTLYATLSAAHPAASPSPAPAAAPAATPPGGNAPASPPPPPPG